MSDTPWIYKHEWTEEDLANSVVVAYDTRSDPDYEPPTFGNAREERAYLRVKGWRPFLFYWQWRVGVRGRSDEVSFFARYTWYRRRAALAYLLNEERLRTDHAYRAKLRAVDPEAYDAVYANFLSHEWGEPRGRYGSAGL